MKLTGLLMAALEFIIVVSGAVLFPPVGIFLAAPLAAVIVGTGAGWMGARESFGSPDGQGAVIGAIAGVGALLGTIVGIAILAQEGDDTIVHTFLGHFHGSEDAEGQMSWLVYFASSVNVTALIIGGFNLALSAFSGLVAGLISGPGLDSGLPTRAARR